MKIKNKTRFKSLDKIANHPHVKEIWDEGPIFGSDLWLTLHHPYACPHNQSGVMHEYTCKDLISCFENYLKNPCIYNNDQTGVVALTRKAFIGGKLFWIFKDDDGLEVLHRYRGSGVRA